MLLNERNNNVNIPEITLEEKYKALYQKLFDLIPTTSSIPSKEWTPLHILAYIMKKYKERFNTDYKLSYSNVPSKCYEYSLSSRLKMILNKNDIKDYIDWFYENYNSKTKFRSVGALTKVELVARFEEEKIQKAKITMYTKLPDEISSILQAIPDLSYVSTYGELYFIYKADESLLSSIPSTVINQLKELNG